MAAYDRDPIVEAMLALYETVLLMSNSPAKDLFIAPPSGWHFNEEQLAILQDTKSRTVIDLILHLPYLFGSVDNYAVAYQTTPINYYNSDWFSVRSASDPYGFGGMMAKYVEDSELPLTMQHENVGVILMLDTRSESSTIPRAKWNAPYTRNPKTNAHPYVATQVGYAVQPVVDVLRDWRQNFLDLRWMVTKYGQPDIVNERVEEEEKLEAMRKVYWLHGWPDDFRATECVEALQRLPDASDEEMSSDSE